MRKLVVTCAFLVGALALPSAAAADTFAVTTTADPAGGSCAPGGCSLRQAVQAANDNGPGDDVIKLRKGNYALTRGQLAITSGLSLIGTGSRRTIIDPSPSPGQNRALDISSPTPITVTVSSLMITKGDLTGADGGGIFLESAASTLNLDRVSLYYNEAFNGAGVRADGTLNISRSTFFANHALGVAMGSGPALAFRLAGRGSIVNSTFVANHGPNRGGAIDYSPSVANTLSILNSTIADNHADSSGGGIAAVGRGTVVLRNTIIARNTINRRRDRGRKGPNCVGRIRSAGHNLEGPAPGNRLQSTGGRSCPLHARGDRRGREPLLTRTQDNGGPTDTREPLRHSPAINHATRCPRIDQRGVRRGRRCDIGAVEFTR
jgi:CSLREA domain-containing protein